MVMKNENSKFIGTEKYLGFEIELYEFNLIGDYINAYVELKGSNKLSDDMLGNPTYRDNDVVGVDTVHYWNINQTYKQKKEDALIQIKRVIENYVYKKVFEE